MHSAFYKNMNTSHRLLIVLMFFSTSLLAKDFEELEAHDFSRFLLLNEGTGEINDQPDEIRTDLDAILPDPKKEFPELEIEELTEEEKEKAKKIALQYWILSPGLRAEETITPQFSIKLNEAIEGFAAKGTRVWQVIVEERNSDINALILVDPYSEKVQAWGIKRELKNEVEPNGGHNSGSSAASIVTP